jgi:hypothetical protein
MLQPARDPQATQQLLRRVFNGWFAAARTLAIDSWNRMTLDNYWTDEEGSPLVWNWDED